MFWKTSFCQKIVKGEANAQTNCQRSFQAETNVQICQKNFEGETNAKICQKRLKGEANAHKDKRNQIIWNCARSQKGNVKLGSNQTGALVTKTHTICHKVPAVT